MIQVLLLASLTSALYTILLFNLSKQGQWTKFCLTFSSALLVTLFFAWKMAQTNVYGGVLGDNSFHIAHVNTVIYGNYLGDYYEKNQPGDYPPLYFWIVGTVSRWLNWTAIQGWRNLSILVLIFLPVLVFRTGLHLGNPRTGMWTCITFFGLGAFNMHYFISPERNWGNLSLALQKPHELLAALLALMWLIEYQKKNENLIFRSFVYGGLITLLYYPYTLPGLAALVFDGIFNKQQKSLINSFFFLLGGIVLSLAFTLPIIATSLQSGIVQSPRIDYIALWHFDPTLYTIGRGLLGLPFFLSIFALYQTHKTGSLRLLSYALITVYSFIAANYFIYFLLEKSFLIAKWSEYLSVVFGILGGKGLEIITEKLNKRQTLLIWLGGLFLLPNPLIWNPLTDAGFRADEQQQRYLQDAQKIVEAVDKRLEDYEIPTVLASPPIAFVLPEIANWRMYLSPNIHYAGLFSSHRKNVAKLAELSQNMSPGNFREFIKAENINVLILENHDSEYVLRFHRSSRPATIWTVDPWPYPYEKIRFRAELFLSFVKIFQNSEYVVFTLR